jgi:hypothetical protein
MVISNSISTLIVIHSYKCNAFFSTYWLNSTNTNFRWGTSTQIQQKYIDKTEKRMELQINTVNSTILKVKCYLRSLTNLFKVHNFFA